MADAFSRLCSLEGRDTEESEEIEHERVVENTDYKSEVDTRISEEDISLLTRWRETFVRAI